MVREPIWKDTYYTTTADSLTYTIELDGAVIYSGKAVKFPNADTLKININKVCRNYLESDITPLLEGTVTELAQPNAARIFYLKNSNGNILETYNFWYNYTYENNYIGRRDIINGHYTDGMLKLFSIYTFSDSVGGYTASTVSNYTENNVYNRYVDCGDYVLYYLGKRGWASFLIEGESVKKDSITQYKTDRTFNNTTLEFEANRYVSEIKTTYELNTNYLTDEESERLASSLIGSNKVYLHNLKDGTIRPVLIEDTNVVYQKYATNGKKLSQYKITVSESQQKIRR